MNKDSDLERVYGEDSSGPAYRLRKEAVDSKCFSIMTVSAEFDMNKNLVSRNIAKGRFITEQDCQS